MYSIKRRTQALALAATLMSCRRQRAPRILYELPRDLPR